MIGVFGLAFGLMAIGYGLLGLTDTLMTVLAAAGVVGLGLGMIMPNIAAAAMAAAAPELRGRVAGGMTASILAGHFISPFVSQPIISAFGFASTFLYVGLVTASVATLIGAAAIIHARRRHATEPGF